MKLGCWCPCKGWLRDVYGSVGVGPWWRLRLCCSKKGKRLVATIKYLMISGIYAGGIIYIYILYFFFSLSLSVFLFNICICIAQPVAGLKRGLWGGRCTARCWKMEKGCAEIKHVGKMWCVRWHKTGAWAWCFQIRFAVPKIASAGAETKIF